MKQIAAFFTLIFMASLAGAQTIDVTTDFPGVIVPEAITIDNDDVTTITAGIDMKALRLLIRDDAEKEVDDSVADNVAEGGTVPENRIKRLLIRAHNRKLNDEAKDVIWQRVIDTFTRLRRDLTDNRKRRIRIVNP